MLNNEWLARLYQDIESEENKKPDNFMNFFFDVLNHHIQEWDDAYAAKETYEQREHDRVIMERNAEFERVAQANR